MPRRLPASHDDLREKAVAAARAAVGEGGLPALTARRIASELGCSVGSLYNLFADLDDLVLHVAAAVVDDMHAALFRAELPAAPADALVELALRYVRFAETSGRLWAMIFEHEPRHDRPTPAWHLERIDRLFVAVSSLAEAARAPRATTRADVEALWASVHGVAALAQKGKLGFVAATPAETLAARVVETFLVAS